MHRQEHERWSIKASYAYNVGIFLILMGLACALIPSDQLAGYAGDVWFPQPRPRIIPGARCRTTA